jgi:hypothetical protein
MPETLQLQVQRADGTTFLMRVGVEKFSGKKPYLGGMRDKRTGERFWKPYLGGMTGEKC